MQIATINASMLGIPFRLTFRHASAARSRTQTLWVEARDASGVVGYGESCPRDYVTAETIAGAEAYLARHTAHWCSAIHDYSSLKGWADENRSGIDANPSGWAAVEMALLDLMGKLQGRSMDSLLGLPELAGTFRYSAVLGDATPRAFEAQLAHYLKAGFDQFKIKLAGDFNRDAAKVTALKAAGIAPRRVRADANNLWSDAATVVDYLRGLDYEFFALEEPLSPGNHAGMMQIAQALGCRIILDESLLRKEHLMPLYQAPAVWIGNLRISKMGGLLRSLELVGEARRLGLSLIVGAHVGETSLLTRTALTAAHAAGNMLLAQEGAFGTHLLEHDVIDPPLMFKAGGLLEVADWNFAGQPGLGLSLKVREFKRDIAP